MDREVVIPARFNGPPQSGHGGYSAGVVASAVDGPAEVSLRLPPPLERPLTLRPDADGGALLLDGDALVAAAKPVAAVDVEVPPAVTIADAERAAERFPWHGRHPFPTCFACGPDREPGDGLRQFSGPVDGSDDTYATAFTTPADLAGDDGTLATLGVWASLDCPTGVVVAAADPGAPCVLARLTVEQRAPVRAGETHVTVSRFLGMDGRKLDTMAALYDGDGDVLAVSRALWIALTPEQAAAMTA